MSQDPSRRPVTRYPVDKVIRLPRVAEVEPRVFGEQPTRRPKRVLSTPFLLLYGFFGLIVLGTVLLALPIADSPGQTTPPIIALFTATSAVTVTGHTAVSTAGHWSFFGQAVIFVLMLVGGLGFMVAATFVLIMFGQKYGTADEMALRETLGADQLRRGEFVDLRNLTRTIVSVVFLIYIAGAIIMFPTLREIADFGVLEAAWQSAFLSVSSFNSAGFSILPEISDERSLAILDDRWTLQALMAILIIIGGIGWIVLVDMKGNRRFSRLSLNTKLVLVASAVLWIIGFVAYFLIDYITIGFQNERHILARAGDAMFHSISGRTAGFIIADFGEVEDFTKLIFSFLMLVGGGSASVAGGIKVNTLAVVVMAVISTIKARPQTEAFGREIPHTQVFRALAIAFLAVAFIIITVPVLTITEAAALRSGELHFVDLFFDTVSAFSTNGSSTGIVPQLGIAGQIILIVAMVVGRIGPLTLALTLVPQEQALYRFSQERVTIG